MEASLSRVLVGEFQDDQDCAPEEAVCPRENRTECLGAFCRGRGMARAGGFAVEVVCRGPQKLGRT